MSPLRLSGSTSGFSQLDAPAIAGDQTFTLPGTGGTIDRLNRAGNILQVVNATYSTQVTNNTSTYADTGLSASITPSSASSKVIIIVNQSGVIKTISNVDNGCSLRLLRNSTNILANFVIAAGYTGTAAINVVGTQSACYIDSPATTSAVTYKTQFANYTNAASVQVQVNSDNSTILLLEVAA